MCGPLVLSVTSKNRKPWEYHLARLAGYTGIVSALSMLEQQLVSKYLPVVSKYSWYLFCAFFIYWGASKLLNFKKMSIKIPGLQFINGLLFKKIYQIKNLRLKSALVGLGSSMLPCGFLYVVILSLVAMKNYPVALVSILAFWLGTLPALLWGAHFLSKKLSPIMNKKPKISGVLIMAIGLTLLSMRSPVKAPETSAEQHSSPLEGHKCH
jgi:sulfite exporter TauE/SafE